MFDIVLCHIKWFFNIAQKCYLEMFKNSGCIFLNVQEIKSFKLLFLVYIFRDIGTGGGPINIWET